ncbi:hypothetical protein POPTR_004G005500v4 [Populus trichocarpa]|uniref:Uncharacterized protein n=1 Tax=Populus trichocarpa TaxID=3694 RepID=A0ACC0T2P8_POPTR|nr:uncharacterized protein LOC18097331 [Populus trichocarpa]KAI9395616.1 hypothetical protein POPTR_004G005500v4 [Populus trichocarpa]
MNKKGLSILMRAKMRPNNDPSKLSPFSPTLSNGINQMMTDPPRNQRSTDDSRSNFSASGNHYERNFDIVKDSMGLAISLNKTESLDVVLDDFSQGYFSLSNENRKKLVIVLAKEYDLNRIQVRELLKQYLGLELRSGNEGELSNVDDENMFSAFYRIERNLRQALKPTYNVLFERLNNYTGGLKFLSLLRADILSFLGEENIALLRALDSCLKEKLSTWLSPAVLELHQITWDDSASLLEKIVTYEAVHPISNLLDLKRRLGVGRRCFGYFHPAIPGEPLIFIEVALLKNVAQTIQEVLLDVPPIPEHEAACALFYSISSTQPGLAGINLGKFLIKRMITLVKRDMPQISTFATLSPIPGFMQWLLSKLASQSVIAKVDNMEQPTGGSGSTFQENLLEPDEERMLLNSALETYAGKNGMEVMLNLLTSKNYEWTSSAELLSALKPPLMRLCARYLLQEKKRGKALDSVANFHLQNGAMVERLNWMADRSERGLRQSGGIMVNYVYRVECIEQYAQSYFSTGHIHASSDIRYYIMAQKEPEETTTA